MVTSFAWLCRRTCGWLDSRRLRERRNIRRILSGGKWLSGADGVSGCTPLDWYNMWLEEAFVSTAHNRRDGKVGVPDQASVRAILEGDVKRESYGQEIGLMFGIPNSRLGIEGEILRLAIVMGSQGIVGETTPIARLYSEAAFASAGYRLSTVVSELPLRRARYYGRPEWDRLSDDLNLNDGDVSAVESLLRLYHQSSRTEDCFDVILCPSPISGACSGAGPDLLTDRLNGRGSFWGRRVAAGDVMLMKIDLDAFMVDRLAGVWSISVHPDDSSAMQGSLSCSVRPAV